MATALRLYSSGHSPTTLFEGQFWKIKFCFIRCCFEVFHANIAYLNFLHSVSIPHGLWSTHAVHSVIWFYLLILWAVSNAPASAQNQIILNLSWKFRARSKRVTCNCSDFAKMPHFISLLTIFSPCGSNKVHLPHPPHHGLNAHKSRDTSLDWSVNVFDIALLWSWCSYCCSNNQWFVHVLYGHW